jgi:hypothetical protein
MCTLFWISLHAFSESVPRDFAHIISVDVHLFQKLISCQVTQMSQFTESKYISQLSTKLLKKYLTSHTIITSQNRSGRLDYRLDNRGSIPDSVEFLSSSLFLNPQIQWIRKYRIGVKVAGTPTIHLYLLLRLRICGFIPPFLHTFAGCGIC